ncbi:lysosome-associated membrane glycoprotein 1 [Misgurnus anguillicaudatus]|uniref:lysosome-associated membrane glycoprotein 1 n=1 Tax=Misgurnus anguillicaudatus TaxID=75329 RepID=UPI003CCF0BC7
MEAKMRNGLLSIGLFMAAIALTSGVSNPNTTTLNPNTTAVPLNTTTPHPNTTAVPLNTTTPHPNTTAVPSNATTPNPNTTVVPTNATTAHPNTTVVPSNATTAHPNTTVKPSNATTAHPKTTAHPTPVPQPTPPPTNSTLGHYNVTSDNKTCIMADFEIKIVVNNSEVNGTFIVQPSKTNSSGYCEKIVASLLLRFNEGEIALKFRKNDTSKMVYVEMLEYDLTYAFKSGAMRNYTGKNESLQLFAAAAEHSYSCKSVKVFMGQGVHLDFSSNRVQAYNIKNKEFGKADLCKADQPDYRVPIAVGIILVILIVIVVIAYLVSRKRRTDGYQSL